jgi:formylglycine-generating enzyme required for sulfatase activity
MARRTLTILLLVSVAVPLKASAGVAVHMIGGLPTVMIPKGSITPLYPPAAGVTKLDVAAFYLMTRPVTNGEFRAFVERAPNYRRDRIARVFAESRYLAGWAGPLELGGRVRPAQPVTEVSWYAARSFCRALGMRLPLAAEWELAAAASRTGKDASSDPAHQRMILDWYAKPREELPDVPYGEPNIYGVSDLHGVIWEWVEDFNSTTDTADARGESDGTRERFCGAGAALARGDARDYAAFMRVAQRSALQANYTGALLGFRCAADLPLASGAKP